MGKRIESEKRIIEVMIRLYCRKKLHAEELPEEYKELLEYAHKRLSCCRFGDKKTSCKLCPIHCYGRDKREMMREVMRWCGPRMLVYHPLVTIAHYAPAITKWLIFVLYTLVVICMGAATIVEKYEGSAYVSANIYGAWWFSLLWAALAVTAIVYFLRHITKAWSGIALHLAFIVILVGAFTTHVCSERGMIHLRKGFPTTTYTVYDRDQNARTEALPFTMQLNRFDVKYHSGTDAAADYVSQFTITDKDGKTTHGEVSMNNIFSYGSMRCYQSSYDSDMLGATISTNSDPIGIPITYTGYALLFISLITMLFDPRGAYRQLLRSPLLKKGALLITLLFAFATNNANAAASATAADESEVKAHVLSADTAEKFGKLYILYNNRICPMQTFALDFTKKLYGSRSYKGMTPEQVLTGWIFWGEEWMNEPMMKMKSGEMKSTLQLPDYVSANQFFNQDMGGYILGPYISEYYNGNHDKFHTQVADTDDRLQLIMNLRRGLLLKIFPYTNKGKTTWLAPTDELPVQLDYNHKAYIQTVFTLLYDYAEAGNMSAVGETVGKMLRYQQKNGGTSLPSESQVNAERIYNAVPFATILFMVCLTMGFLTFLYTITRLCRKCRMEATSDVRAGKFTNMDRLITWLSYAVMLIAFAALTYCEWLRWTISGTVPMANGYETMLFVAWIVMAVALLLSLRFRILLTCGFLMSGFFLLVSHISQMDPQITHVMPVLNSPLLSVHVSIIMLGFALLSLTFICAVTALIVRVINRHSEQQTLALQQLSLVFLYPAMTAIGIGIFVGAIWANVSWGQYWGWDPKEVWALITFMVYAAALHPRTLPSLRRPTTYHVFMLLAFLTIIMTYFGVNYFLGGMHSYA